MKQTILESLLFLYDAAVDLTFTQLVQLLSDNWYSFPSTVTCLKFVDKLEKAGKTYW